MIQVRRAIVHVIDHKGHKAPFLSEGEIPLGQAPEVRTYFEAQIEKVAKASGAYPARFDPTAGGGGVPAACRRLLAEPKSFVSLSQDLARALFAASAGNTSISVGSLLCCLYTSADAEDAGDLRLAVIKIDLKEVLIQEVEEVDGHPIVTFSVHGDALPTLGERLLKAALVWLEAREVRLKLLDLQNKGEPAEFFAGKFLQAIPILNSRQETELLYSDLRLAVARLATPRRGEAEPVLTAAEVELLEGHVDAWFHRAEVDTERDLAAIQLSTDADRDRRAKELIRATLDPRLVDRSIRIDPAAARTKVRKVRLRGDQGVEIEFDDDPKEKIYQQLRQWQDDDDVITEILLTVRNLKRLP